MEHFLAGMLEGKGAGAQENGPENWTSPPPSTTTHTLSFLRFKMVVFVPAVRALHV